MPFTQLSLDIWEDLDLWLPYEMLYKGINYPYETFIMGLRREDCSINRLAYLSSYECDPVSTAHIRFEFGIRPGEVPISTVAADLSCIKTSHNVLFYAVRLTVRSSPYADAKVYNLGFHVISVSYGSVPRGSNLIIGLLFDLLPKPALKTRS